MITAFDVIEAKMASRYAERADGWPVGPEKKQGGGWYTPSRSVQILRAGHRDRAGFLVVTLFPFCRIDLRYPTIRRRSLHQARQAALARLVSASGGARLNPGQPGSVNLWNAGGIIGLEAL